MTANRNGVRCLKRRTGGRHDFTNISLHRFGNGDHHRQHDCGGVMGHVEEEVMEKLKPCPFCGGKAELYESEAYNLETEEKEEQIRFFAMCEECTALVCGLSKKVAAERWNRRASDGK